MKRALLATLGFLLPTSALAVSITDSAYGWSCAGFLYCGGPNAVVALTANLILGVSLFIGPLAVVVFLYGAIRMIVSRGDEGKEAGKKALIWASAGLVAALLVGAIVRFIHDYIYVLGA